MNKRLLGLIFLGLPCLANAGDIEAGKAKSAICAACHGSEGVAISPIYPNLNGQNEGYLSRALKAYKAGQRKGGLSSIMVPQAVALSDTDIEDLAAYFSSLK